MTAAALAFVPSAAGVTEQQKLTVNDGAEQDKFGWSVAISGDTLLVGAPNDDVGANANQGSAYVFTRSGGVWSLQAQLNATDGAPNDNFGWSVALDGDTALVGAPYADVGGNADEGAAYVFTRGGTTWTQQGAQLASSTGAASDNFGYSVALSGDTAVVGAPYSTVGANADQGSSFVFVRSGTVWTEQERLTGGGGAALDAFGWSVAVDGETALVGAPYDNVGANADQGSSFVFVRSGTVWTEQAQLLAADGTADDSFGTSVALSGDTALVGAPDYGDTPTARRGAAYVFVRSGAVWGPSTQLLAADGGAGHNFGTSVALDGATAVVGSPYGGGGNGTAYAFAGSGTSWSQSAQLFAGDGAVFDGLGWSVAADGGTDVSGSPGDDVTYQDDGSAYVFEPPPTAAAVAGLSARRSGRDVVLRWRGPDPTVLGYQIYQEHAGKRIRLTRALVIAGRAGAYRYVDRSAPSGQLTYRLRVVRTDGSTPWAGSIGVVT